MIKNKVASWAFRMLVKLFGEPEEMVALRKDLDQAEERLRREQAEAASRRSELETCREERLGWMARESAVRKELQDCRERSKDLLEQVVRLTHQKRSAAKDLLDQKFKTEATPLERNRFEMELTEARGRVRRAEERAKEAEERLARNQTKRKVLEKQAKRARKLESELLWSKQQSAAHLQALGAAVERIRLLEVRPADHTAAAQSRRAYKRPAIRKALVAEFEALA